VSRIARQARVAVEEALTTPAGSCPLPPHVPGSARAVAGPPCNGSSESFAVDESHMRPLTGSGFVTYQLHRRCESDERRLWRPVGRESRRQSRPRVLQLLDTLTPSFSQAHCARSFWRRMALIPPSAGTAIYGRTAARNALPRGVADEATCEAGARPRVARVPQDEGAAPAGGQWNHHRINHRKDEPQKLGPSTRRVRSVRGHGTRRVRSVRGHGTRRFRSVRGPSTQAGAPKSSLCDPDPPGRPIPLGHAATGTPASLCHLADPPGGPERHDRSGGVARVLNLRRPHLSVNLNRSHPSVNLIRPQRLQIPYNPCIGPQQPLSQGTPGLPPPTRLALRCFVDFCARTQLALYHGPASGLYRHALDVPREPTCAPLQPPKVGEVDPARPATRQVLPAPAPTMPTRQTGKAPLRAALRSASASASSCPSPALSLPGSSTRDQPLPPERWPRAGRAGTAARGRPPRSPGASGSSPGPCAREKDTLNERRMRSMIAMRNAVEGSERMPGRVDLAQRLRSDEQERAQGERRRPRGGSRGRATVRAREGARTLVEEREQPCVVVGVHVRDPDLRGRGAAPYEMRSRTQLACGRASRRRAARRFARNPTE
jgi:hypothetical protein